MDEELEALRRENAALKKELEQQTMNAANLAREAFLADLVGSNRLSPEEFQVNCREFHVDLPSDRFALMAIVIHSDVPFSVGEEIPDNQESLRYVRFLVRNVMEDLVREKNICHVLTVQGELMGLLNLLEPDEVALESVAKAAEQAARAFMALCRPATEREIWA